MAQMCKLTNDGRPTEKTERHGKKEERNSERGRERRRREGKRRASPELVRARMDGRNIADILPCSREARNNSDTSTNDLNASRETWNIMKLW